MALFVPNKGSFGVKWYFIDDDEGYFDDLPDGATAYPGARHGAVGPEEGNLRF